MAIEGVNRYSEFIKSIIAGPFYDASGTILPYRSGGTELRLVTDSPDTQYGLYVNDTFVGSVASDTEGNVVFSKHFDVGENVVTLINNVTGVRLLSYITIRHHALWQIAYAETIESVDDDWQTVKNNQAIELADMSGLEDVYGSALGVYNNQGLDTESYRWQLHELRMAFRNYGGKYGGVEAAVSAFTQVNPFGYTRRLWGPNWVLDQQMLANSRFLERSTEYTTSGVISGVSIDSFEADVPSGTGSMQLQYNPITESLRWGTTTPSAFGPWVRATDGHLFIPGPEESQGPYILGMSGPFSFNSYPISTRFLYLEFDEVVSGVLTRYATRIDLSTATGYPYVSLSDLISCINLALVGTVVSASSYNGRLIISSTGNMLSVNSGVRNAAVLVFGASPGDLVYSPTIEALPGIDILSIGGSPRIDNVSTIQYDSVNVRLRWWSPGYIPPAPDYWVNIPEDGHYTLLDGSGSQLNIHVFRDYLVYTVDGENKLTTTKRSDVTETFSINFFKSSSRKMQTKGVNVLVDTKLLPTGSSVITEPVTVIDDTSISSTPETPDRWWLGLWSGTLDGFGRPVWDSSWTGSTLTSFEPSRVVNDTLDAYAPTSAFRYRIQDASKSSIILNGRVLKYPVSDSINGRCYPQRDLALFYDYEGFRATFSAWFINRSNASANVYLGFSFDSGATWQESSVATSVGSDPNSFMPPKFASYSVVIPANLTPNGVWVRIRCDQANPGLDISIESANVDVTYITSRVLGNTTVSRSRHRQYFGELVYLWSPGHLITSEQKYLGVIYKNPDTTNPVAGVYVEGVTDDTPVGLGTFEYRYTHDNNPALIKREIRWSAAGEQWPISGSNTGWVTIDSRMYYDLPSFGGSFLQLEVNPRILPVLSVSSTVPVVIQKTINISDNTQVQGVVRDIAPAHSSLDIIDVSEFDVDGRAYNVKGPITEGDFSDCDLVNLLINNGYEGTSPPGKNSFLKPSQLSVVAEELAFSVVSPYVATLLYESDSDQTRAVLTEDGIVVPNNQWSFNSANEVELAYSPLGTYELSYGLLYQVTTQILDLSSTFQDYAWYADYTMWNRMEYDPIVRQNTVPIYFSFSTGVANFRYSSTMDQARATLYYEGADGRYEVSKLNWSFLSPTEVKINASQYVPNAQFYLTHDEVRIYPKNALGIIFEHRSGVNQAACEAAAWQAIERNNNVYVHQPAGGHIAHQLRLSITGVRDLRDFRVRSVVLKGLHIHGSGAFVKGLTNV